ncbi:MAG: hypothetical protein NC238_14010 [Dehalobacter sp.]|nr:hypothetical protein [Dehalobacter sp.]
MSSALRIIGIIVIIGGFICGLCIISEIEQLLVGIICVFSGVIIGVMLLAGAVIIDLLDRIVVNQENILPENESIKPVQDSVEG